MKVKVPDTALMNIGISGKYFKCSLADMKNKAARRICRTYTQNYYKVRHKGYGLVVFGDENGERNNAFYGVLKALFAQKQKVKVVSLGDIVSAYFDDKAMLHEYCTVDVLGITEMGVPEEAVNKGGKVSVLDLFRKRADHSKAVIVASCLEIEHPAQCVDMMFPGMGSLLALNTVLVNVSNRTDCVWLRTGHSVTVKAIEGDTHA